MIIDESYWCPDCGTTHSVDIECDMGCDECGFHTWPYYRTMMDGNHGSSRVCKDCYTFDQGQGFAVYDAPEGAEVYDISGTSGEFPIARCGSAARAKSIAFLLAVGRRHRRDDEMGGAR